MNPTLDFLNKFYRDIEVDAKNNIVSAQLLLSLVPTKPEKEEDITVTINTLYYPMMDYYEHLLLNGKIKSRYKRENNEK